MAISNDESCKEAHVNPERERIHHFDLEKTVVSTVEYRLYLTRSTRVSRSTFLSSIKEEAR